MFPNAIINYGNSYPCSRTHGPHSWGLNPIETPLLTKELVVRYGWRNAWEWILVYIEAWIPIDIDWDSGHSRIWGRWSI